MAEVALGLEPPRDKTVFDRILYGIGSIAFGVKDTGFTVLLMIFYNQALGLPAASVGFAIMVALLVDAVADPFIGRMSDGLRSRWGRRHPFMLGAALPIAISYYFLWNPPEYLNQDGLFVYLMCLAIIIRVFISVYEIPSSALVVDLVRDYDKRTAFMSWRWFFGYVGGLGSNILAFSYFLRPGPNDPAGQLNVEGYASYGLTASFIMLAAIVISSLGTARHIPSFAPPPPRRPFIWAQSAREIWETLINKPFLLLAAGTFFASAAAGITAATLTYFRIYLWELTGDQISGLMLGYFAALVTALFFAPWLGTKLGKKRAAITLSVAAILCSPIMYFSRVLGIAPDNGTQLLYILLFTMGFINTTIAVSAGTMGSSMFADVVEYAAVRTGRDSAGLIFSANAFLLKAMSGIGVFGAGLILTFVAFPENATQGNVSEEVLHLLALTEPAVIMFLQICGLIALISFPINREVHEENLRAIARKPADEPEIISGP
jgi:GPH family glycoside/pentoside/hexuronide:cation symporter